MTNRGRFRALMAFRPGLAPGVDRLPVVEWAGWWDRTIDRWHREGLPAELTDRYAICRHFGLDIFRQHWFVASRPGAPRPPHHGAGILADEAGYEAVRTYLLPEPAPDERLWRAWADEQRRGQSVIWITLDGFFWFPRALLGIERHLYAFYDRPGLLHRINADLAEWHLKVLGAVCDLCVPDFMTFAEDMSYNHGPMISKGQFEEFLAPYYRKVVPALKQRNVLVFVDSDGDVAPLIPWLEAVGVDGLLPLERMAGVDVAAIRRRHPRWRMLGGFDKRVMHRGEAAIRGEFERLLPVAAQGGFVISCDHQTPPEVSYDDYRLYVRLFREYAALQ
jgi:hypothetical protein